MRGFISVTGVLSLAAVTAGSPSKLEQRDTADTCAASTSTSTVFLTAPPSTVTIHDALTTSTVFVTPDYTIDVSEAPQPTNTQTAVSISTRLTTTTASGTPLTISVEDNSKGADISTPNAITVTEHTVVTLSYAPAPTSSAPGVISYYVQNGTTHYLGGQTPVSSESFVYETQPVTITVEPVNTIHTAPGIVSISSPEETTTLVGHTTITSLQQVTVTETLSVKSSGSAPSFTGIGPGGWNSSSATSELGATGTVGTAGTAVKSLSAQDGFGGQTSLNLATDSSIDIYAHTTVVPLSSLAAASGFQGTSTYLATLGSPTSDGESKSANGGQVTSSTAPVFTSASKSSIKFYTPRTSCTESGGTSSAAPPFGNSTISGSGPTVVGSTSGIFTSIASGSFSTVYTSISSGPNSTASLSSNSTQTSVGSIFTISSSNAASTISSVSQSSSQTASNATSIISSASQSYSQISSSTVPSVSSSVSQASSQVSSNATSISTSATTSSSQISSSSTSIPASAATSSSQISTSASATLNGTSTASSTSLATPTSTSCGLTGDFTMNFDDIPPLDIGNQDPNIIDPSPIFSPYHQFDWSDGWVVVPPPTVPYLPESRPLLLEFIPNFNISGTDENGPNGPNTKQLGYSGDFAGADRGVTGCFNFNFYGAALGCDSTGPDCVFSITGYIGKEVPAASQTINVPACPPLLDCTLKTVTVDDSFRNLSKIRMNLTVAGEPKIWWMDDVRLGWTDNSCAKGLCRQTTHVH